MTLQLADLKGTEQMWDEFERATTITGVSFQRLVQSPHRFRISNITILRLYIDLPCFYSEAEINSFEIEIDSLIYFESSSS